MLEKGDNMKKLTYVLAIAFALVFSGCNTTDFFVIDSNDGKDETTVVGSFNDETYVWESWLFSTNRVDK